MMMILLSPVTEWFMQIEQAFWDLGEGLGILTVCFAVLNFTLLYFCSETNKAKGYSYQKKDDPFCNIVF